MSESQTPRLGSVHLEDLAIVALTARPSVAAPRHPVLDEERRARLRARLKQVSRHDWPATVSTDPLLRRGYTLRQCCRVVIALLLIDAHLAPTVAIPIARTNEPLFLKAMLEGLDRPKGRQNPTDRIVLIVLGELVELVEPDMWSQAHPERVRLVERRSLNDLWSQEGDLSMPGQRLALDVGVAAAQTWAWLSDRQLMPEKAHHELRRELEDEHGR